MSNNQEREALPPLPKPHHIWTEDDDSCGAWARPDEPSFTAAQTREYALAAREDLEIQLGAERIEHSNTRSSRAIVVAQRDLLVARAAQPAAEPVAIDPMTDLKTKALVSDQGYRYAGFALEKAGDRTALVIGGAVRWLSAAQFSELMFPENRQPAAPAVPTMDDALSAGDGTLHGAIDYWQQRALGAEERLAEPAVPQGLDTKAVSNMLTAYIECIKQLGDYESWHYIPEIEQAAEALSAAPQAPSQAEVQRDAERLDFIERRARYDPKMDCQHVWWPTSFNHSLKGPNLRAAIDAAMAQERQAQEGGA